MDLRDTTAFYTLPLTDIDARAMTATLVVYNEEADEEDFLTVYLRWAVCPLCDGKGHHVNPSIDANGLSAEDFAEDPDFREDYFSGTYDVPCYQCGGLRVVVEPDPDRNLPETLAAYDRQAEEAWNCARERVYERDLGY